MTDRPVVLMTLPIPDPAQETIAEVADIRVLGLLPDEAELSRALAEDVDVFCSQLRDPVTAKVLLGASSRLRGICNYAAGFDNIDVPAATRRGVWVTNTPDVVTAPTAELTIALMLAAARRLVEGDGEMRAGRFTGWRPDYLLGTSLVDKRLGLIGLGRIGSAVARAATALRMTVVSARSNRGGHTPPGVTRVDLDELLTTSDVVSLHVPLTPQTRHLIGARELKLMKPTAILVNTSRGPLVDERALAVALSNGVIWSAALDVYEHEPAVAPELLGLANVVLAPHLGTATREARSAMAQACARNVVALLRGDVPPTPVNRPSKRLRTNGHRPDDRSMKDERPP